MNLTPQQVYTMASIVEEETNKEADKGNVASVYINRIKNGHKTGGRPYCKICHEGFWFKKNHGFT